jgi:hypothetical protein
MKKIDYFFPRNAVVLTGVTFVSICISEMQGKIYPGYEWGLIASAGAFAASVLWAIGCIVWNAWRSKT